MRNFLADLVWTVWLTFIILVSHSVYRGAQVTENGGSRMEDDDKDEDADNEDNEEDDEDNEEDEEEDDDEEGEEDDDDEEGDADEEEEDDDEDDGISEDQKEFDAMLASGKLGMPTAPVVVPTAESLKMWGAICQQHGQQPEEPLELSAQDFPAMAPPCACHHCVSPAQTEPRVEVGCTFSCSSCKHVCWAYALNSDFKRIKMLFWYLLVEQFIPSYC